jgi:hypothetical protein
VGRRGSRQLQRTGERRKIQRTSIDECKRRSKVLQVWVVLLRATNQVEKEKSIPRNPLNDIEQQSSESDFSTPRSLLLDSLLLRLIRERLPPHPIFARRSGKAVHRRRDGC